MTTAASKSRWVRSTRRLNIFPRFTASPVLDKALITADRRYEANVRAKLDFGSVPFTLRF